MLVNLSKRVAAATISGALKIYFTLVDWLSNLSVLEDLVSAAAWFVAFVGLPMKVTGRIVAAAFPGAHQDTIT